MLRVPVRFGVQYLETSHPSCSCVPSHEQLLMCRHSLGREWSLTCTVLSGESIRGKEDVDGIFSAIGNATTVPFWLPLKHILVGAPWLALLIWVNCFPGLLQNSSPGTSFYCAPELVPPFLASYNPFWITFYLILSEENSLEGVFYM